MFRAIGFLIILWGITTVFSSSVTAFDAALTATFAAVERAAVLSENQLELLR
jgi:hypothetical protein